MPKRMIYVACVCTCVRGHTCAHASQLLFSLNTDDARLCARPEAAGMGTACMKVALDEAGEQFTKQLFKALNTPVAEDIEGDDSQGRVFVMTCCLDYKATENPLTCTIDGNNWICRWGQLGGTSVEAGLPKIWPDPPFPGSSPPAPFD